MKRVVYVILIAVLFVAPYIFSFFAEREYNGFVKGLTTLLPSDFKVTGKFSRGFFHSTAITEITVPNIAAPLTLTHNINQGPIIFNYIGWYHPSSYIPRHIELALVNTVLATSLGAKDNKDNKDNSDDQNAPQNTIITNVSFSGKSQTIVKIDAQSWKHAQAEIALKGGLVATINTDKQFSNLSGDCNIPVLEYDEFSLTSAQSHFAQVKNVQISFRKASYLAEIMFDFHIEDLAIGEGSSANNKSLDAINNIIISLTTKENKTLLDVSSKITFDKLTHASIVYGPAALSVIYKNMPISFVQDLLSASAALDREKENKLLIKLLTNIPTIQHDLQFKVPLGTFKSSGQFTVGGPKIIGLDMAQLLPTFKASVKLDVSNQLAYSMLANYAEKQLHTKEHDYFMKNATSKEKNPYTLTSDQLHDTVNQWVISILDYLEAQKMLVLQKDHIDVDVEYANQAVTINGKPRTKEELAHVKQLLEVTVPGAPVPVPTVPASVPTAPASVPTAPTPTTAVPESVQK